MNQAKVLQTSEEILRNSILCYSFIVMVSVGPYLLLYIRGCVVLSMNLYTEEKSGFSSVEVVLFIDSPLLSFVNDLLLSNVTAGGSVRSCSSC